MQGYKRVIVSPAVRNGNAGLVNPNVKTFTTKAQRHEEKQKNIVIIGHRPDNLEPL
ncbi:hypothetical protein JCM30760_05780 [Thiomicrorhabdus hydrogeniphila]